MKGLNLRCTVIPLCIVLGVLFNLWAYTSQLIDVLVVLGYFSLCLMLIFTVFYFVYMERKTQSKK